MPGQVIMKLVVTLMGGGEEEYPPTHKVAINGSWLVILNEIEEPVAVYAEHRIVKAKFV